MCAARDDTNRILEAEKAAERKLDAAKKRAQEIMVDAEEEAKEIVKKARSKAKRAASRLFKKYGEKRDEETGRIKKETKVKIKALEDDLRSRETSAIEAVVNIVLGGD